MTDFFVHLLIAAFFTSCGYYVASLLITRGLRDDIARLDSERADLDRQRKLIDAFLDESAGDKRIEFDLGAHRRTAIS